jgi:hypothetical protein
MNIYAGEPRRVPSSPSEYPREGTRWRENRVVIRIKSALPPVLSALLPAGGNPSGNPPAPGLSTTWTGPALQASWHGESRRRSPPPNSMDHEERLQHARRNHPSHPRLGRRRPSCHPVLGRDIRANPSHGTSSSGHVCLAGFPNV